MDIRETPIWQEVGLILASDPSKAHHSWKCELVVDGEIITPQQLISVETLRQYSNSFCDSTVITLKLLRGTYIHRLLPYKDNFKVVLYREPITEVDGKTQYDEDVRVRTYRGVVSNAKNEQVEDEIGGTHSEEEANRLGFVDVDIQLIDLAIEQLRMQSVAGIYREMTTTEVVQGVLTKVSGELGLSSDEGVKGVDMVPGMNDAVRDHIVIPNGIKVTDFPTYVQKKAGGIYGSGIGYYFQDGIWYVYPEYNVKRFDQTPKTLNVFNVPKNKLPGIERTYAMDGDRLLVLATGETKHFDETEAHQLNYGNGVRFANADRILNGFHEVASNKVNIARPDNVEEFYVKSRRSGLNQAPLSDRRITANPYHELSELSRRIGSVVQVDWQHADVDLVYPGMPVRYVFTEDGLVREVYGVVVGCDHLVGIQGSGMLASKYSCEAILHLYLEMGE